MLKVLHIAPGIDGGGVGGVIYNYLSNMDLNDMHIEVLVRDYGHRQFLHDRFDELGIKVHYVIQRKKNPVKHFQEIDRIMKEGHFDVVHCHDQNWSVLYLKMAEKNGVNVRIAHSHLTVQTSDRIKIAISNLFTRDLKKTATGYFACGNAAGEYMWGSEIAGNKQLYVMKNAVDTSKFQYNQPLRKKYREAFQWQDKCVIGHIGRFSTQKNHQFLIDIFATYKKVNVNAVLVLIGIGELEQEIRDKVRKLNLDSSVYFLGQRNDARELYNAFDVFLLPSLYEGLPVVGVEAQANGLPCLFSSSISEEVKVLDSTVMMELTQPAEEWARKLDDLVRTFSDSSERKAAIEAMNSAGYNIQVEAERLKQYYFAEASKRRRN